MEQVGPPRGKLRKTWWRSHRPKVCLGSIIGLCRGHSHFRESQGSLSRVGGKVWHLLERHGSTDFIILPFMCSVQNEWSLRIFGQKTTCDHHMAKNSMQMKFSPMTSVTCHRGEESKISTHFHCNKQVLGTHRTGNLEKT